jgi:hypothetical protein
MNRPGALIIQPADPTAAQIGLVVCGVCGAAWHADEGPAGDRREGDRRHGEERRSNWTAATGRPR